MILAITLLGMLQPPTPGRMWSLLFDTGHAVLFAGITAALFGLVTTLPGRARLARPYAVTAGLAVALAGATEFIQMFSARDADLADFLRDLAGIAAALAFLRAVRRPRLPATRRWLLGAVAGLLLLAPALPPLFLGAAYLTHRASAPLLFDFETASERHLVQPTGEAEITFVNVSDHWDDGHGRALAVRFGGGLYPGVVLGGPNADWSGYARLVFEVFSPLGEPVPLVIRLDDAAFTGAHSDHFNRTLMVPPGASTAAILLEEVREAPQGRPFDLATVQRVVLFTPEPKTSFTLYFDRFRLEGVRDPAPRPSR